MKQTLTLTPHNYIMAKYHLTQNITNSGYVILDTDFDHDRTRPNSDQSDTNTVYNLSDNTIDYVPETDIDTDCVVLDTDSNPNRTRPNSDTTSDFYTIPLLHAHVARPLP